MLERPIDRTAAGFDLLQSAGGVCCCSSSRAWTMAARHWRTARLTPFVAGTNAYGDEGTPLRALTQAGLGPPGRAAAAHITPGAGEWLAAGRQRSTRPVLFEPSRRLGRTGPPPRRSPQVCPDSPRRARESP